MRLLEHILKDVSVHVQRRKLDRLERLAMRVEGLAHPLTVHSDERIPIPADMLTRSRNKREGRLGASTREFR